MFLQCKCPKCESLNLVPSFELTSEKYVEEYLKDIKTMMPFTEPPKHPGYLVLECNTKDCGYVQQISLEDFVQRVMEDWSYASWAKSRQQLSTPENYEEYFKKYIFDKGHHLNIKEEDRKRNPFLDAIIKHVEEKYSKNS